MTETEGRRPGRLARVVVAARRALASPAGAFVAGVAAVLGCVLALWWFSFDSGLTAPAGFVYSQF